MRIAEPEGAHETVIVPSGLSAIALAYVALCKAGDHVLVLTCAYGPNLELVEGSLAGFGVTFPV